MRNVVTLSDIPKALHDWLKMEAARRSKSSGRRVGLSQVVVQAVCEFKERVENHPRRRGVAIPRMEIFRKRIKPAELKRACICMPKAHWSGFDVGNTISMRDAEDGSTILVPVQSQHRLGMGGLYSRHGKIKVGDELIFEQQTDGMINIKVVAI